VLRQFSWAKSHVVVYGSLSITDTFLFSHKFPSLTALTVSFSIDHSLPKTLLPRQKKQLSCYKQLVRIPKKNQKNNNMPAKKILLLNGPNLNLLGTREPGIYGSDTLSDIETRAVAQAAAGGATLSFFQTNWEGALLDRIHQARTEGVDAIVINPAAFTHYSIALRDALLGVDIPFVEVHISNVHAREDFRKKSWLSDKAAAVVCGLGTFGYKVAIEYCLEHMKTKEK